MKCVVVLKRLTHTEIRRYHNGQATSSSKRLKPRVRRLVVSDDEEDEPVETLKTNLSQNVRTGGTSNEHTPALKASSTEKQPEVPSSTSKTKFVVEKLPTSLAEQTNKSNTPKPASHQQQSQYTVFDVSDSDDDIFPPKDTSIQSAKTGASTNDYDDDVIDLSSDEETFSCTPRQIKSEPMDAPDEPENPTIHASSDDDSDSSSQDSRDSDGPFFPVLSQGILAEIEAEEAEEAAEKAALDEPSTSDGRKSKSTTEKLESIVAQQRSKPKEKQTILTAPKALDTGRSHTNRRFSLATGSSGKGKNSSRAKNSFRDKLTKDQDLMGYAMDVKNATSKNKNAPVLPAPDASKSKSGSSNKETQEEMKTTKKSQDSAPSVAAKSKNQPAIPKVF